MLGKFLFIFSLPVFLFACNYSEKPEIRSVCESDKNGHYIVKWETFPPLEGIARLYQSYTPDSFPNNSPVAEQPIDMGVVSMVTSTEYRPYFKLVFNKKHSIYVAERGILTPHIYNLRDIGGYYNRDKHQVKWGKIYRSGSFSNATKEDVRLLDQLNIKTIIDCRRESTTDAFSASHKSVQIIHLPLHINAKIEEFIEKIEKQEMKRGDVLIMQQDIYVEVFLQNGEYFGQLFDILLNETNYPVVIQGHLGKDQIGLIIALILHSLNVSKEQITQDYMLSNSYIDFHQLVENAKDFSFEQQEALTTLLSANETALEYVRHTLNKKYGSVDNYLKEEVGMTSQKREKLRNLLLY